MRSAKARVQPIPTSLMSGAVAHTVKPSLEPPSDTALVRPARKLSLGVIVLGGVSAVLGLAGAAGLSHLRARPEPVMQIVSGSPVLKKAEDGESVRWHSKKSKIYFDASLDAAGEHARDVVQMAFGTWVGSSAKLPSIEFDTTKSASFGQKPNGKSEVMYGPIKLAGHENDLALTVTFSDPKTGEVIESDMIFNSNQPFGSLPTTAMVPTAPGMVEDTMCQKRYDLQSVATHEAGHFFGLGEDFDARTATMFYTTGRCETNKRALQSSDESTMSALYVASDADGDGSEEGANAKGCGGARIGQGSTGSPAVMLLLSALTGLVAWRRRKQP